MVEDNPGDVLLLREAFLEMNAGMDLRVARDGAEALDILFRNTDHWCPAVIILDLNLPKVSGHEVLRRLKGDAVKQLIPVVILTSSRLEADIRRAYDLHANAYIRKPNSLDELMSCMRGFQSFWMETVSLPDPRFSR